MENVVLPFKNVMHINGRQFEPHQNGMQSENVRLARKRSVEAVCIQTTDDYQLIDHCDHS